LLFAALLSTTALAQVEKGVITGLVKDSSGAIINKAQVTLRNSASGLTTATSTNGEGLYVSPPLDPGNYDVEIEAAGFKCVLKHVRLEVAQRISANANLAPGGAFETVEVEATTVQFDTDTSTVSNIRTEQTVHDLPLNGRNFAELLGLGAGGVPGQSQLSGSIHYVQQRGPSSYAINGQRMTDKRFLVDGIGDNENNNGLGIIIFPPIDAVEEFHEETADTDARYGRSPGGRSHQCNLRSAIQTIPRCDPPLQ
jgi:Carboxypeptidase regulatory-like domain